MNIGLGGARFTADGVAVERGITPAENRKALLLDYALEDAFALQAIMLFDRQKAHGHAISARLGQRYPQFAALLHKKLMRNLDQNSRAIARFRVTSRGAAMGEVDEYLQPFADDLVASFALDAGHKTHAAGIVLITRVIKPLRLMSAETIVRCAHGNPFR